MLRRAVTAESACMGARRGHLSGMIERPDAFDAVGVEVSDAVHAPGYGRLNDSTREAMAMARWTSARMRCTSFRWELCS